MEFIYKKQIILTIFYYFTILFTTVTLCYSFNGIHIILIFINVDIWRPVCFYFIPGAFSAIFCVQL